MAIPVLPIELWTAILRDASEVPQAHDTSYHDPFESHHIVHPLKPSGTYFVGDHSESLKTKRSLVKVCAIWNAIATPFLFETVRLSHPEDFKLLHRTLTQAQSTRASKQGFGQCIIRLDVVSVEALDQIDKGVLPDILACCTNIKIFNAMPESQSPAVIYNDEKPSPTWLAMFPPTPLPSLRAILSRPTTEAVSPSHSITLSHLTAKFPNLEVFVGPEPWFGQDEGGGQITVALPASLHTISQPTRTSETCGVEFDPQGTQEDLAQSQVQRNLVVASLAAGPNCIVPGVVHLSAVFARSSPLLQTLYTNYPNLTHLTIDSMCPLAPYSLPNLEYLAISNTEKIDAVTILVIQLINETIDRNPAGSRLKVVHILDGESEGIEGANWLWPCYYESIVMLVERDCERMRWRDAVAVWASKGVRVEDSDGRLFDDDFYIKKFRNWRADYSARKQSPPKRRNFWKSLFSRSRS